MSSTIGNILKLTIFGESHGLCVGLTIDGLPAGIEIDSDFIQSELQKRKEADISTTRTETDEVKFLSGIFEGKTTGSPFTFIIENNDVKSSDYQKGVVRPSHADLTAYLKSNGNNDYRGGGFTSGRVSTPLIVAGAICKQLLSKYDVEIVSHISSVLNIEDDPFDFNKIPNRLNDSSFPVISNEAEKAMRDLIENAKVNNDSVGGTLETAIINCPACLGEPFFDSLESYISHLLFSIGGVKGVLFGDGMGFATSFGSEVKDELSYKDGKISFSSNHNGGINGGISNGQPMLVKTVIKPTSSIAQSLNTINLEMEENIVLNLGGRHDPCLVHRIRMIQESLIAFALLDMLMLRKSKEI